MSSIWKIDAIDIYVTGNSIKDDVKLAKLTPLDSADSSTLHFFGSGAEEVSLKGKIFSETNVTAIKNLRKAGTTITLTTSRGSAGTFKINSATFNEYGPFVKLSLSGYDPDPEDTSIYDFQIELIKV